MSPFDCVVVSVADHPGPHHITTSTVGPDYVAISATLHLGSDSVAADIANRHGPDRITTHGR